MSLVDELIEDSRAGLFLNQSPRYREARFDDAALREATGQIQARPDATAFHLLMALRREAPERYGELPEETRAEVLTAALAELPELNDFGYLDPGGSWDGEAAHALLELGTAAQEALAPLLDDHRPAPLAGSETATMSEQYGYRRSDFAYRYLSLLSGEDPSFSRDRSERDQAIDQLRVHL